MLNGKGDTEGMIQAFRQLSAADRNAITKELSAKDQLLLETTLLEEEKHSNSATPESRQKIADESLSFDPLSPWLSLRLEALVNGDISPEKRRLILATLEDVRAMARNAPELYQVERSIFDRLAFWKTKG